MIPLIEKSLKRKSEKKIEEKKTVIPTVKDVQLEKEFEWVFDEKTGTVKSKGNHQFEFDEKSGTIKTMKSKKQQVNLDNLFDDSSVRVNKDSSIRINKQSESSVRVNDNDSSVRIKDDSSVRFNDNSVLLNKKIQNEESSVRIKNDDSSVRIKTINNDSSVRIKDDDSSVRIKDDDSSVTIKDDDSSVRVKNDDSSVRINDSSVVINKTVNNNSTNLLNKSMDEIFQENDSSLIIKKTIKKTESAPVWNFDDSSVQGTNDDSSIRIHTIKRIGKDSSVIIKEKGLSEYLDKIILPSLTNNEHISTIVDEIKDSLIKTEAKNQDFGKEFVTKLIKNVQNSKDPAIQALSKTLVKTEKKVDLKKYNDPMVDVLYQRYLKKNYNFPFENKTYFT